MWLVVGGNGGMYSLCPDIVANGLRGRCTAEGPFYRRNYLVPPRQRSIRRRRKRIVPTANGLPSENESKHKKIKTNFNHAHNKIVQDLKNIIYKK